MLGIELSMEATANVPKIVHLHEEGEGSSKRELVPISRGRIDVIPFKLQHKLAAILPTSHSKFYTCQLSRNNVRVRKRNRC